MSGFYGRFFVAKPGVAWVALGLASLALTACGGGSTNPFARSLPDETRVVDGPNLALPPQFELRPPREAMAGAAQADTLAARSQTQALMTGVSASAVEAAAGADASEAWLTTQAAQTAGTAPQANVRAELDVVAQAEAAKTKAKAPVWRRLFGAGDK